MYYILKRGKPKKARNYKEYIYWDIATSFRIVSQDYVSDVFISTTFLGIEHGEDSGHPLLWETMIFGGEHNHYQERYASIEAARIGHKKAVELAKE